MAQPRTFSVPSPSAPAAGPPAGPTPTSAASSGLRVAGGQPVFDRRPAGDPHGEDRAGTCSRVRATETTDRAAPEILAPARRCSTRLGDGMIDKIEVAHGLPLLAEVVERPARRLSVPLPPRPSPTGRPPAVHPPDDIDPPARSRSATTPGGWPRLGFTRVDREDLEQELALHVLARRRYDPAAPGRHYYAVLVGARRRTCGVPRSRQTRSAADLGARASTTRPRPAPTGRSHGRTADGRCRAGVAGLGGPRNLANA